MSGDEERCLFVVLKLSAPMGTATERAQIRALADGLDLDVQSLGVGEFDGHEIGDGEYLLSFCGDVDRLIEELRPLLHRSPLSSGGRFVRSVRSETGRLERTELPI